MDNRQFMRLGSGALCLVAAMPSLALDASISGVEDELASNIEVYLDGLDASQYQAERLEEEVRRLVGEALRPFGYYEPDMTLSFDDPASPSHVSLDVDKGKPVRIERLDFVLEGAAAEDPLFTDAIEAYPQEKGDILRHAPYDSLRSKLSGLAMQRGYFDWGFRQRRLEVRPWAHSAYLSLGLDSGPRYHFGEVHFSGQHIESERLRNLVPFEPGSPYLAGQVARLNQNLGQTQWFGSVSVRPRLDAGPETLAIQDTGPGWWYALDVEGIPEPTAQPAILDARALGAAGALTEPEVPRVPIDVQLTPADRHQFETGIGFSTDVGPRARLTWNQPWVNRYGHSWNHDLYISSPEQKFTGVYSMPLEDPLNDSYELQYGLRNKDQDDTQSTEASVEFGRRWKFENGWEQYLYVRSTFEDFTQAGVSNQVLLVYPGVQWSRTRTRNPTFPTWGDRQQLTVQYANQAWGSEADFLRVNADTHWIRMLGDSNRFVGRLGMGSVTTDDFDDIPPSLRFFAGGDNSVRGYSYESLAPRDDEGRLEGGAQRFVASVEAQRKIADKWWLATFVDAGDAFSDWWPDQLNTGAGLGIRWISPVGPIRFDVAHPFDHDDSFRIHFSIGPEF
ncbi:autotransporter assembly complex protein TamA [Halomonas halmophila]|uniref:Translocation and assembly module subunit TamA n=1 Tax=Halomonas halmophila TaxID=252 RepID=A0A4Y4F3P8_9GAMM|nr:autotransporter assembly complex family protein [Halomonas halmophila]GED22464.1 outer membrane protein assembly factor [Halomonas halmophila]